MYFKNNSLRLVLAITLVTGNLLHAYSQASVCLGTDITVCTGAPVTITNCNPGQPAPGSLILNNPTAVSLTDDSYSGVVNLGFTFNFYGTNYTQCVIGSNGVVTFDLTEANGYCPWALGGVAPLPNAAFDDALRAQMPAYHDINPSAIA